eukprot:scaffold13739_cov58-Phaeocystis_antarctica.AAC.5
MHSPAASRLGYIGLQAGAHRVAGWRYVRGLGRAVSPLGPGEPKGNHANATLTSGASGMLVGTCYAVRGTVLLTHSRLLTWWAAGYIQLFTTTTPGGQQAIYSYLRLLHLVGSRLQLFTTTTPGGQQARRVEARRGDTPRVGCIGLSRSSLAARCWTHAHTSHMHLGQQSRGAA